MADVADLCSEGSRKDEKEVVDLMDDDDDEKTGRFCVMKEAYCILPHREEYSMPLDWTTRKFKGCTTMYLGAPAKFCFLELDLELFSKWYAKLPLSNLMDYHKQKGCNEVWEFSVILLNPKLLVSCPDQTKKKRYEWAKDVVSTFYKGCCCD